MTTAAARIPLFDTETCTRCGGGGNYSFNLMYGTTCFGCGGSGKKIAKRHVKMANDWVQARRAAKDPMINTIQVGDFVAFQPGETFREVTAIEIEPGTVERNCGWSALDTNKTYFGWVKITLADGETVRYADCVQVIRKATTATILSLCKLPATVKHVTTKVGGN